MQSQRHAVLALCSLSASFSAPFCRTTRFLNRPEKFWYDGVIHKLKCNGIEDNILKGYVDDRHQRVVLNGVQSNWVKLEAGVLHGSVLGPLLFLVYINNLTDKMSTCAYLQTNLPHLLVLTMFMNVMKDLEVI